MEWKTLPSKETVKGDIVVPHLYRLCGEIRYVFYKPLCAVVIVVDDDG